MADKLKSSKSGDLHLHTALVEDGQPESRDDERKTNGDYDTICGIGCCQPSFLQCFAKVGCFTGFYSIAGLMTSTLSVYVNSQVTTLERQFGFSSKQTGLIMAANDMGFLIFVLFISYLANMVHIPRALATTTILYSISGLLCALPHFLYGHEINQDWGTTQSVTSGVLTNESQALKNMALHGQLCQLENAAPLDMCQSSEEGPDGAVSAHHTNQQVAVSALIIIVIGMMVQGIGKTPRYSFTVTYIDNNTKPVKTGFFMGIIITLSILGPALAFTMGGLFTRMYVTLEDTNLHPKHPRWIGAWWLGYVVFGSVAGLVALPLFCFPRRLPRKGKRKEEEDVTHRKPIYKVKDKLKAPKDKRLERSHQPTKSKQNGNPDGLPANGQPSTDLSHKAASQIKDFVFTFGRLWTNPVYLLITASNCFIIFTVGGTSAYTPKYIEHVFDLPAHRANYIMAAKTLAASSVGTFVGGYLSKRWKLTALASLKFTVTVIFTSIVASVSGFFLYCDQPDTHNLPGSIPACASECQCQDNSYFPVCGADGRTYYSPCAAGCQVDSPGSYHNCTCIEGGVASGGICPYACDQVYYYATATGLRALMGTMAIVPKLTVTIRSVLPRDKPLAIGFSAFMSSLLGWLLGPVLFGVIIDGVCTIWDVSCDVTGRCLLYDNFLFRMKLNGFAFAGQVGSLFCQILALIYAKCTGCLDDKAAGGSNPEQRKKGNRKVDCDEHLAEKGGVGGWTGEHRQVTGKEEMEPLILEVSGSQGEEEAGHNAANTDGTTIGHQNGRDTQDEPNIDEPDDQTESNAKQQDLQNGERENGDVSNTVGSGDPDEHKFDRLDSQDGPIVDGREIRDGLGSQDESHGDGRESRDEQKADGFGSQDEPNVHGHENRDEQKVDGLGNDDEQNVDGLGSQDEPNVDGRENTEVQIVDGLDSQDEPNVDGRENTEGQIVDGLGGQDEPNVDGRENRVEHNVDGLGSQDEPNVDGRENTEGQIVDGLRNDDEPNVDGRENTEVQIVDGLGSQDELNVDGRENRDEQKVDGLGSQDEPNVDGRENAERQIVDGLGSQDEPNVDGRENTEVQIVDGLGSQDEPNVDGGENRDEQKVDGLGSQDEPNVDGRENQDNPKFYGLENQDEQNIERPENQDKSYIDGGENEDEKTAHGHGSQVESDANGLCNQDEQSVEGRESRDESNVDRRDNKEEKRVDGLRSQVESVVDGREHRDESKAEGANR